MALSHFSKIGLLFINLTPGIALNPGGRQEMEGEKKVMFEEECQVKVETLVILPKKKRQLLPLPPM